MAPSTIASGAEQTSPTDSRECYIVRIADTRSDSQTNAADGIRGRHVEAMVNILAIDPGGTTGIAIKLGGNYQTCVVESAEDLWNLVSSTAWDAVIYEQFATGGLISKYGLHTTRLIGGIQALCHHFSVRCFAQPPQRRKAYLERAIDVLRELHKSNHDWLEHEKDALAHLLAWEAAHKHDS